MNISSTTIYDVDLQGEIDSSGKISQLYGKDAVANSIKLWLTSFKNDFIRNPGRGGYVTSYLYKPMTPENAYNIRASIIDGFNQDYTPTAVLREITVTPDYNSRRWVIDLVVYVNAIKSDVPVIAEINNFV